MKQTTDELKKIIKNAPEGATHMCEIEFKTYYLAFDEDATEFLYALNGEWNAIDSPIDELTRSLSDIQEIIELREAISNANLYLDSFIDAEQEPNLLPCYACGCEDSCKVDFLEAEIALGIIKDAQGRN